MCSLHPWCLSSLFLNALLQQALDEKTGITIITFFKVAPEAKVFFQLVSKQNLKRNLKKIFLPFTHLIPFRNVNKY